MVTTVKRRLSDSASNEQRTTKILKAEDSSVKQDSDAPALSRDQRQERVFANMRLRRIVKENHACDINQLSFFFNSKNFSAPVGIDLNKTFDKRGAVQRDQTDTSNVLATAGGCQINVYDNEHCGDHLDIMSNFDLTALQTEEDTAKRDLRTFCWLYKEGDAWLAAAGADGLIHLVSLANSQEIDILYGHTKPVLDLQGHPYSDSYILSTSKDGSIRLWDVDARKCLVVFEADASVACFHPSGTKFVSGTARGELREWRIPDLAVADTEPVTISKRESRLLKKMHGDNYIDCIRFANGNILSKSINGRMEYWDAEQEKSIRSFRVRTGENFSRFDVSLDERFFCVGTSQGSVYIYNLETGKMVSELAHRRSTKSVRCCAFSRDCRKRNADKLCDATLSPQRLTVSMAAKSHLELIRSTMMDGEGKEEQVEVNQRHLIDKILARYSAEYVLYRELLQNSGNYMIKAYKSILNEPLTLDDATSTAAIQARKRLANPVSDSDIDEQKIGAFGVGFYSLFSVCENPFVFSGSQCMAFYFKGDQLFARRADVPADEQEDWTSFLMDLREPMEMPDLDDFSRFLTTSLGFTTNLREISVYFDQYKVFSVTKRMAHPREMAVQPRHIQTSSPQGIFTLTAAAMRQIQLDAEKYTPPSLFAPLTNLISKSAAKSSNGLELAMENATIFLRVVEATLAVHVSGRFEREMERATKKKPPKTTKFQLVYTSQEELHASENNTSIFKDLLPFPEQGRVFIGFPTHQTTGCCCHMAARFIPTVERESIDFADRYVSVWNKELLAMGGHLSRLVYDDEIDAIDRLYKELVGNEQIVNKLEPEENDDNAKTMLQKRASHALYSFTFRNSTPSAIVGRGLEERFLHSGKVPLRLMTSHGIESISGTRLLSDSKLNNSMRDTSLDSLTGTFVKTIPTLTPTMVERCRKSIEKFVSLGLLKPLGFSDIIKELNSRPLNEEEMVGCMKWWIAWNRGKWNASPGTERLNGDMKAQFLDAAILDCGDNKLIPLSQAKWWINPKIIPLDVSVPPSTLPFAVTKSILSSDLRELFGDLAELSILEWSRYIKDDKDLEVSPTFAERVFTIVSRSYSHCSSATQADICALFKSKRCMPTKHGMERPSEAYFTTVNLFDDLPIIQFQNGRLISEQFLMGLGVRKHVDLQLVFDRLISDGSWSHIELVKYLTTAVNTLSAVEIRRLRETAIFTKEGEEPKAKEIQRPTDKVDSDGQPIMEIYVKKVYQRYKANELYAPIDTLRNLQLPLIYWDSRWRTMSAEAKFLEKLGLWSTPPLSEILRLASPSANSQLQKKALAYLIDNYKNYETTYDASKIDVKFLPCADGKTYAAPRDCFTNPDVRVLGFHVLHTDLVSVRDKLGVLENPPSDRLVTAFLARINEDHSKAKEMFEYMSSRLSFFGYKHSQTLREAKIVPIVDKSSAGNSKAKQHSTILVRPSQCYFETKESNFFKELFPYVSFGTLADSFLRWCGVKDEPTPPELTSMIVKNPMRFWEISGGGEGYLSVLRRIASQFDQLRSHGSLIAEMRTAPFLVGIKKNNMTEMPTATEEYSDEPPSKDDFVQYCLAKASDIFIIDDTVAQQIFSPLSAPMEVALEEFYAHIGSERLSKQVKVTFTYDVIIGTTAKTKSIAETIFERLPIIVYQMMNDNLQRQKQLIHDEKYAKQNLKVIQVKQLKIIRKFRHTNEENVQSSTACADKNKFTVYVSSANDIDYYDIANALCSLLFRRVGFNDAIVVERYLTASLNNLRRKGLPVDRILHIRKNVDTKAPAVPTGNITSLPPAVPSHLMDQYTKQVREVFGDCQEGYIRQLIGQQRENHVENVIEKLLREDYPRVNSDGEITKESKVQEPKSVSVATDSRKGTRLLDRLWGWGGGKQPSPTPDLTPSSPLTTVAAETEPSPSTIQKPALPNSEKTITPNYTSNIKQNLKRAIHSCKAYSGQDVFSPPRINKVTESKNYCDATPGHNLIYAGELTDIKFYVHRGIAPEDVLNQYPSAMKGFSNIVLVLAKVFDLKPSSMHIFYDQAGSTIAFNLNGSLFFNLRYYLALHEANGPTDQLTIASKHKEALIYWFMTTCHELAHNFISDHSSEHEFYMSSFAEVYLDALINHLPSTRETPVL
ncbi:hypothetical protein EC973_009098 [Apophysomyces ossiformis]|uniref:Uncharacterized protein n=1 Tax=Apophysomyces ossiformis TaxID=679940 RepID=A0A8H7BK71_9FUNG|nr:hypothetical protein EC973_009098 [Apophysomyces ossiformis]